MHDLVVFGRRYTKNRAAFMGLIIIVFFVVTSLLAPLIFPGDPFAMSERPFNPPLASHQDVRYSLFGTDDLGRSILGELLYGGRISLYIGGLVSIFAVAIGITIGLASGYLAGILGESLMRVTELFMVIPRFFLALILVVVIGPSVYNVIFAVAITSWPVIARLVRAQTLSLKEREFVDSARATGESGMRIVFWEILPNCLPPVIVNSSLLVGQAILTEAGLSFLGLGDPTNPTWGYMLHNAEPFLRDAWWMAFFPGLAIALFVLGSNLVGDGLNDALNPKMREL